MASLGVINSVDLQERWVSGAHQFDVDRTVHTMHFLVCLAEIGGDPTLSSVSVYKMLKSHDGTLALESTAA